VFVYFSSKLIEEAVTVQFDIIMGNSTEESFRKVLLGLTGLSLALGILLLIFGAFMVSGYNIYLDFITGRYLESAVFILIVGIIVIIVSIIGFVASLKFNFCLMTTFLAIMIVVVISEIITAITCFALSVGEGSHKMGMRKMLKESIEMYGSVANPYQTDAWDRIQTELSCCGLTDSKDYEGTPFFISTQRLPRSCCGPLALDTLGVAEACRFSTASLHKVGCADALKNFLSRKSGALGGMAMGVACFQITIIVGASVLVRKWRNSPDHCYPCY